MIEAACAFTGHRPKSFPWGYDENAPSCVLLKEVLASQISALAEQGVTDFLSGMAQGVDLWCAQIVLDLRKTNPALKLHAILPCEGQERKWTASAQEHYRSILAQANEVIYVGQEYSRNCMLKRNRCLVDHSSILLAVYNGTYQSGTGMTVRYAQRLKREIIIIDPTACDISK
ncbi:MAG: DUF1273 domain-containing protein [Oscillospiraceae bacterium]|jgi:uncharacterized phage-like protein YoqJ|nr:DUF1273 domain-containing protein [Oscillospiraceae bacterium]